MEKHCTFSNKLKIVLLFACLGPGLVACGDSDTGTSDKGASDKPQLMIQDIMVEDVSSSDMSESMSEDNMEASAMVEGASDGTLEAYDPDVPSMIVEDNGVISEEEIYKHWPQQAAATSNNSVSTEPASEAPVAEAKTHIVNGRATSFSPNILFINPGDTVQWASMTSHDSVSMEGLIPENAEPWKFKLGQNGAVTLTEEGVYIYKCNPHYPLGMVAAIIVGKPVNIEQVQANATGRSKGVVIKVVKALVTK